MYVVAGVLPTAAPASFKLWELEHPPVFALEIVSTDTNKDYLVSPKTYALTGVQELVVYDPAAPVLTDVSLGEAKVRWQVWRRTPDGEWNKALSTNADRVFSDALCCWLRVVGEGDQRRLRLATDALGDVLFLSEAEQEREAKEREREAKEQERALRLALEEKLRCLESATTVSKARSRRKQTE